MGHEAIACAVAAAMAASDRLLLSHRNIHYNMARARGLKGQIAEYRLQNDGFKAGQLGCMNFDNPEAGIVYTSSILGNNLAVAPGVALAQKVKATGALTWVVTGDGAMEEGAFYESLLAMKSTGSAAIVIVENNGWSLGSTIEERRCPIDVAKLAASVAVPYRALGGNDVVAYADALRAMRGEALCEPALPGSVAPPHLLSGAASGAPTELLPTPSLPPLPLPPLRPRGRGRRHRPARRPGRRHPRRTVAETGWAASAPW